MAREAGAKKVIFTSCAPQISHPHIYGIDLASSSELIAHARSSNEIAKVIGADGVIYQRLEDLQDACAELSPRPNQKFEVGVFCGSYVTPVKDEYFQHLDMLRGSRKKEKELEMARQAIVQGVADGNEMQVALGAAKARQASLQKVDEIEQLAKEVNGTTINTDVSKPTTNGFAKDDENPSPRWVQDISLHNLNDHQES